ncbi:unnamed protein product [Caenorhabditis auriculariae]|uniref:FYVE-type domain-containing protein n=1 Tax=Caenorhabditis auriculariae TaxID=2777116 RepID=A0A8S1HEC0_9PELO|nr:unnamed protein product [Caenorhabditis auriculariae]
MVDRLVNSEVNARRVANVEQCFGKMGEALNTYGRVLVGEGVLVKMCRKKPKQRQFFFYNKQRIIGLESVQLEDLPDDGNAKNGWVIKTPAKSFAVYAATTTEKREWMIHIERCVSELLERGNKKAAKAHAAVWVPDGEASRCMACGRTQFNIVQRRHHCRSCGHVVCAACSSHTFRLDNVHKKPVRVCDACFNRLSASMGTTRTRTSSGSSSSPLSNHPAEEPHIDSSSESDGENRDSDGANISTDSRPTFYREEVVAL